jgi:hypothetical protein
LFFHLTRKRERRIFEQAFRLDDMNVINAGV